MGAQKKCQLLIYTLIFTLFAIYFLYLLILNIYQTYTIKSYARERLSSWIIFLISIIILAIPLYAILSGLKYNIKFILVYKKKKSEINKIENNETNNLNNINIEEEYFIKRTEYKFKNTQIRKRNSNRKVAYGKIVSCISILSDGKIIFGFNEGTILVCNIDQINYELKQNFSFNKFKLKKILYICESISNEGEIMVSIQDDNLPIKLIRLNLAYKYSLIKELARDKPYIIFQEINKKKNLNNNNINNNNEENFIFKILSFKNNKYLLCDNKKLSLIEKIFDLNSDQYDSSKEYISEPNENINDIIKVNEENIVTLETKENNSRICFYKLFNLSKDNKCIENVLISKSKSNRLCFISETLIAATDDHCIIFINLILKEKIKYIDIDNIIGIGIDFFYDGGIVFLKNKYLNGGNRLGVPYIVKIKKNQGGTEEYNSFSLTNTAQDYKEENKKIRYCESKIQVIKCLKNTGIILIANDEGKLFIWEEIDRHKNNNNLINII